MVVYYANSVSVMLTYTAQILSGMILVWSLLKIRSFRISHPEAGQQFNMKTMFIHATAFGFFIVSVTVYTVIYLIFFASMVTEKKAMQRMFEMLGAAVFMLLCSFVSQCFLCAIFWRLSTPVNYEEEDLDETSESEYVDVEVQVFDEDAEVQRRIWKEFTRQLHNIEDESDQPNQYTQTMTAEDQRTMSLLSFNRPSVARSQHTRNRNNSFGNSTINADATEQEPGPASI